MGRLALGCLWHGIKTDCKPLANLVQSAIANHSHGVAMGRMTRRDKHRNKKQLGTGTVDVLIRHDPETRRMSEITLSIVAQQYEYELTLGPKEAEQLRYLLSIERAPPPNPGI